jgi:hypothetical protein
MSNSDAVEKWRITTKKEIDDLTEQGTWIEIPISDAHIQILPNLWVFQHKQTHDGEIKNDKSRITAQDNVEEKTDKDNYSPVVQWSSIFMMLIVSLMIGWKTWSMDFTNAFVEACLK